MFTKTPFFLIIYFHELVFFVCVFFFFLSRFIECTAFFI